MCGFLLLSVLRIVVKVIRNSFNFSSTEKHQMLRIIKVNPTLGNISVKLLDKRRNSDSDLKIIVE